jgi:hypothetical protein
MRPFLAPLLGRRKAFDCLAESIIADGYPWRASSSQLVRRLASKDFKILKE